MVGSCVCLQLSGSYTAVTSAWRLWKRTWVEFPSCWGGCAVGSCSRQAERLSITSNACVVRLCGRSQRHRFQVGLGSLGSFAGGGTRAMQEASCTSFVFQCLESERFLPVLNNMYTCHERQARWTLNYQCRV